MSISAQIPSRRRFLQGAAGFLALPARALLGEERDKPRSVVGEIGITTGSFMRHLTVEPQRGKLRLLDLPRIMRDVLDMRVIDLMTRCLATMKPDYLDRLRNQAEKAGCIITNLKMNQKGLDLASPDKAARARAMSEYKTTIGAAQRLGCRWVRPSPGPKRPDLDRLKSGCRELIEYAAPKGISLLIENGGWISNDPSAIPTVIRAVGKGLAASPDTGNWSNQARFKGLAKAYPLAVTCDFKAFMFGANGAHPRYDLERCFQIGWDAGFRGPWCIEHFNDTLDGLWAGFKRLHSMLKSWIKEQK